MYHYILRHSLNSNRLNHSCFDHKISWLNVGLHDREKLYNWQKGDLVKDSEKELKRRGSMVT